MISTNDTTPLQPNKVDSRSRISPHAAKVPLQESTPPASRQYLSDKSNSQDHRVHQTVQPVVPPTTVAEGSGIILEHKQHAYDEARSRYPPTADNSRYSRHQRYHSEGEVPRRSGKPSPRSQRLEDPHSLNPQQAQLVESKTGTSPPFTTTTEPRPDTKPPNIAFRTPAVDNAVPVDKKQNILESQPNAPPGSGTQTFQPSRRADANGVTTLVSHYERMEEAARVGGTIARPGTAAPRVDIGRPTVHERSPKSNVAVSSISHSQSASIPQIDRPNTAIGIRSSVSSATQSFQLASSRTNRASRIDTTSYPGSLHEFFPNPNTDIFPSEKVPTGLPTIAEARSEHVIQSSQTIPETQIAPPPITAHNPHGTSNRARPDIPTHLHRAPYLESAVVNDPPPQMSSRTAAVESNNGKPVPPVETPKGTERPQQQGAPPARENNVLVRHHTGNKGESNAIYSQPVQATPSQSHNDPVVRRDDTGSSTRGPVTVHPFTQPRQHKDSSPRVRPDDGLSKAPAGRETSAEDPRVAQRGSAQGHGESRATAPTTDPRYSSQRTEAARIGPTYQAPLPMQRHATETHPPTFQYATALTQQVSLDERGRNKHAQDNYSPNAAYHPPSMPVDAASISPQPAGNSTNSKPGEEGHSRSQRHLVQIKDARLAELLSPPNANEVPHQSHLQDARQTLVSRLEQQPNGSSKPITGNSGNNPESASRLRSSSGRGEHSPRHARGDSSPSGPLNPSLSHGQAPDLSTKDYGYVRSSPNVSQHTPSPRSRTIVTESHAGSQPGTQQRDENSQYGSGAFIPRQATPHEKRQDHASNAEDMHSRKHQQPIPYTTYDANTRTDDNNRTSHIPSNSIPYQTWDQHTGKTASRRGDYDTSHTITKTHSRTRSESQNVQEASDSYSRHPYTTPRDTQTQTSHHVPASNHVPSSAPMIPTFGPSDQMQHSRSHPSNQQLATLREEVSNPPQSLQAPPMKSTPSKRSYIAPLPSETRNPSSSSAPQPPTPKTYEIWLPPISHNDQAPSRSTAAPSHHRERERDYARRNSTMPQTRPPSPPREPQILPLQASAPDPRSFNPYHYLKTRKIRTMSLASVEAQDGAAVSISTMLQGFSSLTISPSVDCNRLSNKFIPESGSNIHPT